MSSKLQQKTIFLTVPDLERWQHYKDRRPPWMKLHLEIFDNYDFTNLPDEAKYHLLGIWLLATQIDNKIPNDASWIARKINANTRINIDRFLEEGHLVVHPASEALAARKQNAIAETEAEAEAEAEKAIAQNSASREENAERRKTENTESAKHHFDTFWKHYPKKKNKGDAEKAWKKIKQPAETLRLILAALRWQTTSHDWTKQGGQFIPYPATYLNAKSWEDQQSSTPSHSTPSRAQPLEMSDDEWRNLENLQ